MGSNCIYFSGSRSSESDSSGDDEENHLRAKEVFLSGGNESGDEMEGAKSSGDEKEGAKSDEGDDKERIEERLKKLLGLNDEK